MLSFRLRRSLQSLATALAGGSSPSATLRSPVSFTFFDETENCHSRLPSAAGSSKLQLLHLVFFPAMLLVFHVLVGHGHAQNLLDGRLAIDHFLPAIIAQGAHALVDRCLADD